MHHSKSTKYKARPPDSWIARPISVGRGLNNTWEWLDNSWTLLTIPQAGHFVQHDATDLVNRTIVNWLTCY